MRAYAFIPARSGSKRVKGKNIRELNGHPLIAYAINEAINSGMFEKIYVSTNSEETVRIAKYYGADASFLRPEQYAKDNSPDIEWVEYTINTFKQSGENFDVFAILRPTSPFRTRETIKRAFNSFNVANEKYCVDSLRAVEKCGQHPYKMWKIINSELMQPLFEKEIKGTPCHSVGYQQLPEIYIQNASLEIAWTESVLRTGKISGNTIMPFVTNEFEGIDINTEIDWLVAEELIKKYNLLIEIDKKPYKDR